MHAHGLKRKKKNVPRGFKSPTDEDDETFDVTLGTTDERESPSMFMTGNFDKPFGIDNLIRRKGNLKWDFIFFVSNEQDLFVFLGS